MQTTSLVVESLGGLDVFDIQGVAYDTWPVAYGTILSSEQMAYMLEMFYSNEALKQQIDSGHLFYGIKENGVLLGFVSVFELSKDTLKIAKLYILPTSQGRNFGKILLEYVEQLARSEGRKKITLNVNRFNKSKEFYERHGFRIEFEEDVEIGRGYLMEDFRMTKVIA